MRDVAVPWFEGSREDLDAARLLHEGRIYPLALYHLQQANEKLVKGLLLLQGISVPTKTSADAEVKEMFGFTPRLPKDYGHHVLQSMLSDAAQAAPRLEEWLELLKGDIFGSQIARFQKSITKSKKGVNKLRKRRFELIKTRGQLLREIKSAQAVLNGIDITIDTMEKGLAAIDTTVVSRSAVRSLRKAGFRVTEKNIPKQQPNWRGEMLRTIRISLLGTLTIAVGAILDPLEAVTRYRNEGARRFDEKDPYVKEFDGLWKVVDDCLRMASSMVPGHG